MTLNSIIANFQTFKLVDLLDILVIAFLIYQLLGIVNRTRAGQLAKGALLVLVVYLVANILNMRTVTWLLNSLLQVGLLKAGDVALGYFYCQHIKTGKGAGGTFSIKCAANGAVTIS